MMRFNPVSRLGLLALLAASVGACGPGRAETEVPLAAPVAVNPPAPGVAVATARFRGTVQAPGATIEFFVTLDPEGGSRISIPAQGLRDGALSEVELSPERAAFLLAGAGAR